MKLNNSKIGDIRTSFILGDITESEAKKSLKDEIDEETADTLIEKWKPSVLKSSLSKAISETEDLFGTLAAGDTILCQDAITQVDAEKIKDIASKNDVEVQIGKYSVTFFDKEDYLETFTNVLEV